MEARFTMDNNAIHHDAESKINVRIFEGEREVGKLVFKFDDQGKNPILEIEQKYWHLANDMLPELFNKLEGLSDIEKLDPLGLSIFLDELGYIDETKYD